MIEIKDNDLPISAANKIINGVKPVSELQNHLCKALVGMDSKGQDMFCVEEIKEIADYLLVYCEAHKEGDY